jgi:hypothetical protein
LLLVELQKSEDSGFDSKLAHYFSVGLLLVGPQKSEQKSERFGADLRLVNQTLEGLMMLVVLQ